MEVTGEKENPQLNLAVPSAQGLEEENSAMETEVERLVAQKGSQGSALGFWVNQERPIMLPKQATTPRVSDFPRRSSLLVHTAGHCTSAGDSALGFVTLRLSREQQPRPGTSEVVVGEEAENAENCGRLEQTSEGLWVEMCESSLVPQTSGPPEEQSCVSDQQLETPRKRGVLRKRGSAGKETRGRETASHMLAPPSNRTVRPMHSEIRQEQGNNSHSRSNNAEQQRNQEDTRFSLSAVQSLRSCIGSTRGHSSWTGSSRACSSWTGSSRAYSSWTGNSRACSSWTGSRMTHSLRNSRAYSSWTGSSRAYSSWTGNSRACSSWTGSKMTHSLRSSRACSSWTGSSHMSRSPPWSPHRSHSWCRNRLAHSSTRACSSTQAHNSWSHSPHSWSHSPHSWSHSPHSWSHSPHSWSHSPHSRSHSPHSQSHSLQSSHSSPCFWWVEGGAGRGAGEREGQVWSPWSLDPLYPW
ncbi:CLK4-associating serine/arginine rich protein-like [Aotus nancymaae]|uniref:CLK4-associating serine/arginine rich protein-like n=1 Tax=Aotus nancymaae TaxID=37293 RepID=UPI0030FF10DD